MKLLYAGDAVWTPWKNGGGVTRQIAAWPESSGLDDFGWRISTARVEIAGPFSYFAGIDRTLAVIDGTLQFRQAHAPLAMVLTVDSPAISFAGEESIHAGPIDSAVTDFNLMTRRGHFSHRLQQTRLAAGDTLTSTAADGSWMIVYVIAGSCRVDGGGESFGVNAADALLIEPTDAPLTLHAKDDCAIIAAWIHREALGATP